MSLADYQREVATVRVSGRSDNGWIRITRHSDGEITVDIDPGELGRHTEQQVVREIESALANVSADWQRQYRESRRRHFGPSMGFLAETGGPSS